MRLGRAMPQPSKDAMRLNIEGALPAGQECDQERGRAYLGPGER